MGTSITSWGGDTEKELCLKVQMGATMPLVGRGCRGEGHREMKQAGESQQPILPQGACPGVWGLQEGVPQEWLPGLILGCPCWGWHVPAEQLGLGAVGLLTPTLQLAALQAGS